MENGAETEKVFILTLRYSEQAANELSDLRSKYFPAHRNFLRAHITMFHSLPSSRLDEVSDKLLTLTNKIAPFRMEISHPYLIGGGVALKVISTRISELHRDLQTSWNSFLTAQDLQKRNPHITIQNKVSAAEARKALLEIARFDEWHAIALGFELYEYLGGPWRLYKQFDF